MKTIIDQLKNLLAGKWVGEGFAQFPSIEPSAYTEETEFKPDEDKDAILFVQKTWYENESTNNGHTVFWDTGFILLREEQVLLHSVQVSGRIEQYRLTEHDGNRYAFDSLSILVDPKATRSQRVFTIGNGRLRYEMNMSTYQILQFQNHLVCDLHRLDE